MFKWIIAALLFTTTLPNVSRASTTHQTDWEADVLFQLGCAVEALIRNYPAEALEFYEKAQEFIDNSDSSYLPISFIISFGQAATYDYLGKREQCLAALGSMFLASAISEDTPDDNSVLEKLQYNDENSIFYGQVIDILRNIALIAPSPDVQTLLLSIVDDIEEELSAPFF